MPTSIQLRSSICSGKIGDLLETLHINGVNGGHVIIKILPSIGVGTCERTNSIGGRRPQLPATVVKNRPWSNGLIKLYMHDTEVRMD